MDNVVYFRGTVQEAQQIAMQLASILTAETPDKWQVARGVFLAMGYSVLADVKSDFVTKSRGGTGEDGVKWKPLSKEYLAYVRRFGPSEKAKLKKAAGLGKQHRFGVGGNMGLLTAEQQKRWKSVFRHALVRLLASMDEKEAKGRAAQMAWATVKREGARTMLEVYGNRQVDILRDTGVLLNSLSPGELSGGANSVVYTKPPGDGGDKQVMDALANGVIVGTNVPYAAACNKLRPFLPTEQNFPERFRQNMLDTASDALMEAAYFVYSTGA